MHAPVMLLAELGFWAFLRAGFFLTVLGGNVVFRVGVFNVAMSLIATTPATLRTRDRIATRPCKIF
jgi:hypothetical protein